jgi:putative ABC transport system permease protein
VTRIVAYLGEAFAAIWRNRTRSILTLLGMIIGTMSIIAVLGISHAASGGIGTTLTSFGDQGISVTPDPNQDDPASAAIQYRDVRALADALGPMIDEIEPQYQRNITLRANGVTVTTFVVEGSGFYKDHLDLTEGRRLTRADVLGGDHVCLLSQQLADAFFHGAPADGEVITVGPTRCTVIGVYGALKGGLFNSIGGNQFLELPYTVFHEIAPGPTDGLVVYPASGITIAELSVPMTQRLRELHGPHTEYTYTDSTAQIAAFGTVINIIAVALTGIGGVALLVAGIGIMNIMLVSVTERTREIGLRKAIGATFGDITLQFLLEAVLLSFIGGGIGTLLGFLLTLAAYSSVAAIVGPAPIPYLLIISVAVGFSTLVGVVFGSWPAIRAARLDPIVALRS